jgi:uncharacterized protein
MASHQITDPAVLQNLLGEPLDFVRAKVMTGLNYAMRAFIGKSPLAFVSTIDAAGRVDVSPKGDPAGFVEVDADGNLLIPERPGNRLIFGFHNILRNGEIGLLFIVPNQRETLRVKGVATLHADPEVLGRMQVNGKPALLYTHVRITECFFHCGKALIRSNLWKRLEPERIQQIEAALEDSYANHLY